MAGIGKAIKGLGLLAKKYKKAVTQKASVQTGKRNKESKQVFDHVKGKPFPPRMQKKFQAADKRHAGMKKAGYKKEPYADSGKRSKTGSIKLKEMWSYNPYKMPKKGINYKKIAKKTAPIGAAAAAGVAYGERKGKK